MANIMEYLGQGFYMYQPYAILSYTNLKKEKSTAVYPYLCLEEKYIGSEKEFDEWIKENDEYYRKNVLGSIEKDKGLFRKYDRIRFWNGDGVTDFKGKDFEFIAMDNLKRSFKSVENSSIETLRKKVPSSKVKDLPEELRKLI